MVIVALDGPGFGDGVVHAQRFEVRSRTNAANDWFAAASMAALTRIQS